MTHPRYGSSRLSFLTWLIHRGAGDFPGWIAESTRYRRGRSHISVAKKLGKIKGVLAAYDTAAIALWLERQAALVRPTENSRPTRTRLTTDA